jgi:hypothetical protein
MGALSLVSLHVEGIARQPGVVELVSLAGGSGTRKVYIGFDPQVAKDRTKRGFQPAFREVLVDDLARGDVELLEQISPSEGAAGSSEDTTHTPS